MDSSTPANDPAIEALIAKEKARLRERRLRRLLGARQRDPFVIELARWLRYRPTPEDLKALAKRSPDRWAQGVAILMRGAGYTEALEVRAELSLDYSRLSDAELEHRLADRLGLSVHDLRQRLLGDHGARPALPAPTPEG